MVNELKTAAPAQFRVFFSILAYVLSVVLGTGISAAEQLPSTTRSTLGEQVVPNYFDPRERLALPDISDFSRIRFLTTTDFPPFNFLDQTGKLAGFHVDLARAICTELKISGKCQIQALPWSDLEQALAAGQGEAIIAGLAITADNREKYAFTRSYLQFPARFVRNRSVSIAGSAPDSLAARRVGVVEKSAHAAMLKAYFPRIDAVPFASASEMLQALREKKVDAAFGDGLRLSFWLSGEPAGGCCAFFGGPYLSQHFLGHGLAIAVLKKNRVLAQAFDHALLSMSRDGKFADLYRRYFPNGMY